MPRRARFGIVQTPEMVMEPLTVFRFSIALPVRSVALRLVPARVVLAKKPVRLISGSTAQVRPLHLVAIS